MAVRKVRQHVRAQIAEAVVCCEETLRLRCDVIPDSRDDPDLLYLFVAVGRLHVTVAYVLLKDISDKTNAYFKCTDGGAHHRLSLQHLHPFLLLFLIS